MVLYVILYAVGRFAVEFFRADERGFVGPLSTSQFISLLVLPIAIGVGILLNLPKEKEEEAVSKTIESKDKEKEE